MNTEYPYDYLPGVWLSSTRRSHMKTKHTTPMTKTTQQKEVKVTFTFDDVSELYHIICNRGFCSTRAKLVNALRELDPELAKRIRVR
jgi:hypothetical protein